MLYFSADLLYNYRINFWDGVIFMAKLALIQKVKDVPSYVKAHWKTPNEGEYLSLEEVVAYTVTQAGSYIFMTV